MSRSRLQTSLEDGRQVAGMFAPAGADYATPGVLSWSAETGAGLELVDLSHPWPADFDNQFTVHGAPHQGEDVTLLDARVRRRSIGDRTTHVTSFTLVLGQHVAPEDRWPVANYRPATLHEWLPETGLSIDVPNEDHSRLIVEWNAPERRTVMLPGAEVSLNPGTHWSWGYAPGWSIETSMTFSVKPAEPQTIEEHRKEYGNPLLSFSMFAADHPDDLTRESYYDPETERGVVVLQRGRQPPEREWQPIDGRYLFRAEDLPDIRHALMRWFEVWASSQPALGLFRETIEQHRSYSVPRFLTLFTAAEGYWKSTKSGNASWSPGELAKRAGVSADLTGATPDAIALIGTSRQYHAHLGAPLKFSAETIVDQTFESTRRLHALLQACLMREIGLGTDEIERLLQEHYRTWPVP